MSPHLSTLCLFQVEKADEEVAGTSASEQPATANTKANKKVQENGAHTSSAKERKAAKEVKGKAAKGEAAAEGVKEDVKVKKERKVYDMPGQTRDTPEEVNSDSSCTVQLFLWGSSPCHICEFGLCG